MHNIHRHETLNIHLLMKERLIFYDTVEPNKHTYLSQNGMRSNILLFYWDF